MEEEMHQIKELGTRVLIQRQADANVVDGKWVDKLKRDAKGEITRYKAWLVSQRFTWHVLAVDYIRSPVFMFMDS